MNYILPIAMIASGVIVGILIIVDKVQEGAWLVIAPMIMFGVWILAIAYVRRRFTIDR